MRGHIRQDRYEAGIMFSLVAAQQQQVVDAEEAEVDERVFGLACAVSATDDMRYRRDIESVLYGCRYSHCAWT